ncbi:MAG: uracil phosphoribosyltransferase [Syntrophomonadaceae bacterium]|nr:uracil phosphoribosyltransferase [Syntrophomonadaceae bacterium]
MDSFHVLSHPLAGNCLKTLRNRDTSTKDFRSAMNTLGLLLAVEATRNLETIDCKVITPLDTPAECCCADDSKILLVPVLRAGLGLVESFLKVLPSARVAHIGMYRDHETLEARPYVNTTPENKGDFTRIMVLDPMLATGNSGVKALEFILDKGYPADKILFVCTLATSQGISQIQERFPQVQILTAAVDPQLNEKAYIVPGLGDAGDRLYLL